MLENGGRYRQAQATGKRSICGISLSCDATLCGINRHDDKGNPILSVSGDVWVASRENVPQDYRPCTDCCAAYKALPAGKSGPSLTERLPDHMDRYGNAPREAEQTERVRARLGRVVPRLVPDEYGTLSRESVWTAGSHTAHAGTESDGIVSLVCRDELIPLGVAQHPDRVRVTCASCRSLIYRDGRLTVRMWAVTQRPHDGDRFRPVGGLGEVSPDPLTRPEHPGLARDSVACGSAMLPGSAGSDMPRTPQSFGRVETPVRTFALRGVRREQMAQPVRSEDGALWCPNGASCTHGARGFHSGWEYARFTGRVPEWIFRDMTREEKNALERGYKPTKRREREERRRLREGQRRGDAARAVVSYNFASSRGEERVAPVGSAGISGVVPGVGRIDVKPYGEDGK